jgi:hypothetical protein
MIDNAAFQYFLGIAGLFFILAFVAVAMMWLALRGQSNQISAIRREVGEYLDTDLKIKKAKLDQTVEKPKDPKLWLNTVITQVTGGDVRVTDFPVPHSAADPKYLLATDGDGVQYYLCSDSPEALRRMAPRRNNLAKGLHPLLPLPRTTESYECSVRTTQIPIFDSQAALLWKEKDMAGEELQSSKLWLYVIQPK